VTAPLPVSVPSPIRLWASDAPIETALAASPATVKFADAAERVRVAILRYAQRRAERMHARMRMDLLRSDQWQMKTLAVSGKSE
jgi:hypothetical protein